MPQPARPKRKGVYGCSFSLPAELATNINFLARALGISQSALLTQLLYDPLNDLRHMLRDSGIVTPEGLEGATKEQALRMRGASVDIIRQRVRDAQRDLGDDLGVAE
jgi:hypothetical protein